MGIIQVFLILILTTWRDRACWNTPNPQSCELWQSLKCLAQPTCQVSRRKLYVWCRLVRSSAVQFWFGFFLYIADKNETWVSSLFTLLLRAVQLTVCCLTRRVKSVSSLWLEIRLVDDLRAAVEMDRHTDEQSGQVVGFLADHKLLLPVQCPSWLLSDQPWALQTAEILILFEMTGAVFTCLKMYCNPVALSPLRY